LWVEIVVVVVEIVVVVVEIEVLVAETVLVVVGFLNLTKIFSNALELIAKWL
jgi:hypothetical protein